MANPIRKAVDNFRNHLRIGANQQEMNIANDLEQQMVIRQQVEEQALEDALHELSTGDTLEYDDYIGVSPKQRDSLKKLNEMVKLYQSAYFVGSFNESNPVASVGFKREDVYQNPHFQSELKRIESELETKLEESLTQQQKEVIESKVQDMVNHVSESEMYFEKAANQPYGEIDSLLDKRESLRNQAHEDAMVLSGYMTQEFKQMHQLKEEAVLYSLDEVVDVQQPAFQHEHAQIKEAHQTFMKASPYYEKENVQNLNFEEMNQKMNQSAENVVRSTVQMAKLSQKQLENEKVNPVVLEESHEAYDNRRDSLRDTYLLSRTIVSPKQAETVVRMLDEQSENQVFDVVSEAVRTGVDISAMAMPGMISLANILEPVYREFEDKHSGKSAERTDFIGVVKDAAKPQNMNYVFEDEEVKRQMQEQLEEDSPLKMPEL